MNFLSLIESKRDGRPHTAEQLNDVVRAFTASEIPDYQMAAWLMAVFFQGLDTAETRALTLAMRDSGERLHFPEDPRPLADKHSTGGIGDKVSLPLAPLLACLGFRVPMISGRGLGITGGTLDKLESIPGFRTARTAAQILDQVQTVGCIICGQTEHMVPADQKLYALRDVTGTVPSIPLITASILSKKLVENLDALVLDVKFGRAAFMPTVESARELAQAMVELAGECGVPTRALLTDMNTPLGHAVGNWLEVREAVACLEGRGPADLRQLVIDCAAHLFLQTERANHLDRARAVVEKCLASGAPRHRWDEMLIAQGADLEALSRKLAQEQTAPIAVDIKATQSGCLTHCDARIIGEVVRDLGGGRLTKDTVIDPDVGIDRLAKPGEAVAPGSVLARIHAANQEQADRAVQRLATAFAIADEPLPLAPLVAEVL